MSFQMVHGQQGSLQGISQRLGGTESHQERPHQTGALGDGNGVEVTGVNGRFLEGLANDGENRFHVFSGRKLGHHAPIGAVYGNLAGHHIGANPSAILHHRRRRFITGSLNPEDQHRFFKASSELSSCASPFVPGTFVRLITASILIHTAALIKLTGRWQGQAPVFDPLGVVFSPDSW